MSSTSSSGRSIREILSLSKLERIIMEYFIRHISAGEIIAALDIKEEIKKRAKQGEIDIVSELDDTIILREVSIAMALLASRGFLEYSSGVYKLAPWIIEVIRAKKKGLYPGQPKSLRELLEES
ncbi:MAG: hypothetical protein LM569_04360 [Desulfurococcaceae archaeon]|nr:hypothetical protein [Desulfurococcaceae archaeon]